MGSFFQDESLPTPLSSQPLYLPLQCWKIKIQILPYIKTADKGSNLGDYSVGSCGTPCQIDSDCSDNCRVCRSEDFYKTGAKTCQPLSWYDEHYTNNRFAPL